MRGELQEVTQRVAKIFTNLERTFNQKQKKDMIKRGFTFLEVDQLEELHQKQGAISFAIQLRWLRCRRRILRELGLLSFPESLFAFG